MEIFLIKNICGPWKNLNFRTFWSSCFYGVESRFFVLEYRKTHFPGLYCLKKKLEKWPFLDQDHGLTPLEKSHFFDFLNFLFLRRRKSFFCSRISYNTFFWPIFPKKSFEKWPLFDQNHRLTPLEKSHFFDFLNFLFLLPKKTVLRSKIS